ncbi:MAG: hypothetical protein ABI586_01625 [Candidatus Nanopelagicales bacterium]
MSAQALEQPVVVVRRGNIPPIVTLAVKEAKRILFSPAYLLLLGFFLLTGGIEGIIEGASVVFDSRIFYEAIVFYSALYLGLITYVAAHLVTSSARRAHADQQLAASPIDERGRGLGLCLGVVLGPFVFAIILMTILAVISAINPMPTVGPDGITPLSIAELAQVAISFAGAGLFGVMLATWLRFPGSLLLGLVVLVFGTAFILGSGDTNTVTPWFAPHLVGAGWIDEPWATMGSQAWHAVYLVGLCLLGVCAVALKQRERRRTWYLASVGAVLFTAFAGFLQL